MFSPVSFAGPQPFNDWFTPDTVQRHPLGLTLDAHDPYWGPGRFMYCGVSAAPGAVAKGNIVRWTETWTTFPALITAGGLGYPVAVAMNNMVTGQFGWIQLSGFAPITVSASGAVGVGVGITGTGVIGPLAAGHQVLGMAVRLISTATVVKTNVTTRAGSPALITNGYFGVFLGMAISGTGVAGGAVVAKKDPDERTLYAGSAIGTVDGVSTATGAITLTGTYTGYNGCLFNNPITQGQIL